MVMKEVPLGVVYGERIDVPVGTEKKQDADDAGYEHLYNPRIKFLKAHSDPEKYAIFTDKPGLKYWEFKMGYENDGEQRLNDYTNSNPDSHFFSDTSLSDTDSIYVREIIHLPRDKDERYKFFSNPATRDNRVFFDYRKRPLGKFKDASHSVVGNSYNFEKGDADGEEKLFYEDSVSGGRRKRRTNRRSNKKRRSKSRRYRRS